MSAASKATLAFTTLSAVGIIISVHYGQKAEKAAMHAGVLRDMERQKAMKLRQADFDLQKALEAKYKEVQPVSDTTDAADT